MANFKSDFEEALGLPKPWHVRRVESDNAKRLMRVHVGLGRGCRFAADGQDELLPVYDTKEKVYRHSNCFTYECELLERGAKPDQVASICMEMSRAFSSGAGKYSPMRRSAMTGSTSCSWPTMRQTGRGASSSKASRPPQGHALGPAQEPGQMDRFRAAWHAHVRRVVGNDPANAACVAAMPAATCAMELKCNPAAQALDCQRPTLQGRRHESRGLHHRTTTGGLRCVGPPTYQWLHGKHQRSFPSGQLQSLRLPAVRDHGHRYLAAPGKPFMATIGDFANASKLCRPCPAVKYKLDRILPLALLFCTKSLWASWRAR